MKNMVVLQKNEDGNIYCYGITDKGVDFFNSPLEDDKGYWDDGGTILLEELEEILDREV